MIYKNTLDDALKTKEEAEKLLQETKETIAEEATPFVLNLLRAYKDDDFWPGRTPEFITSKMQRIYDKRFKQEEVTRALERLNHEGKILGVHMGPRIGYMLKPKERLMITYKPYNKK